MKKILTTVLTLVLAAAMTLSFAGCKAKTKTTFAPSGTSNGTLKLGFDAEYPPYGYLDTETNQYAGFDIEYAKAVCEKLGYTLKLVPIDWTGKDMQLESGNIDCIWSGFTIQGREDDYEWTCPYVDNSIVVLTLKESKITTLADLKDKVVTTQASSSAESALKGEDCAALVATFKNSKFLTCENYTAAYQDLKTGAVDAIVIDIGVAEYLAGDESLILEEPVSSEQYGVGFLKGNTELRDKIQAAMLELATNGDIVTKIATTYDIADSIIIGK